MRCAVIGLIVLLLSAPQVAIAQNAPPVADATADGDGTTLVNESIPLTGTATDAEGDEITEWWWAVELAPSGSTYAFFERHIDQNPVFVADTAGVYQISLTASDLDGRGPTDVIEVVVKDNLPPTAVISASTLKAVAPLWIDFSAALSDDPENRQLAYVWEFSGPNAPSMQTGVDISAFFAAAGIYDVQLTVGDDVGQADITHVQLELTTEQANTPPTLAMYADVMNGPAPLVVNFTTTAEDAEGDSLTYTWNFGGADIPGGPDETHTYEANGSFTAWVTVSDGFYEISESVTITVSEAPRLSIKRVAIKFGKTPSEMATVQIAADIDMVDLNADDTVSVAIDGKRLFAVPFGLFVLAADDDDDDSVDTDGVDADSNESLYKYRGPLNMVFLDTAKGHIRVFRNNINLGEFTPADGATIELHLGTVVLADTVPLVATERRFHYVRTSHEF